jgi:DNA topoisomerase-3
MEDSVKAIVLCAAGMLDVEAPTVENPGQVCDSKKVSDHHAIIPNMLAGETDLSGLPAGEREVLSRSAVRC